MAVAAKETVRELPVRYAPASKERALTVPRRANRIISFPFPSPLLHPDAAAALLLAFRTPSKSDDDR
jgi:hypothetical protein